MNRPLFALVVGLLFSAFSGANAQVQWTPHEVTSPDGKTLACELGRLRVPENRAKPDGAQIELAFVRLRTKNPNPAPPCFYLVGGPGPSGIEYCVRPAAGRHLRLLDTRDVIGIDQRGTGASRPNLAEGPQFRYELPLDRPATREAYDAAYRAAAERCLAYWREQGVDPSAYNTAENAEDLEALRAALGLEQILLWGESYGTHLALEYLRRHSKRVAGAVLVRIEGPDHTLKLPSTTQRYLEQFHGLVAADPAAAKFLPDTLGTVRALLKQLAEKPVKVRAQHEGDELEFVLGPFDLQFHIANVLGLAFEFRDLPAQLAAMQRGEWSALADSALMLRRGDVGSAMALMMDCSSGASPARLERITKERADAANLLSDAVNAPYPAAWAACGPTPVGEQLRKPLRSDARVLFVSGSLDARTPPSNVDELRAGFPNHTHLLAENAGHESLEMLSGEYRELLARFLAGETVASQSITLPPARFRAP
jgi:pimeloyl-ACP methyl ester carboxylesterase